MNAVFHVSGVYGTGLNGGDLALILPECGRADPSNRRGRETLVSWWMSHRWSLCGGSDKGKARCRW